jgi:hypothetical protein
MPFTFSASQKQTIINMKASVDGNISYQGKFLKYGDIYDYIANAGNGQTGVDPASIAWFKGAEQGMNI